MPYEGITAHFPVGLGGLNSDDDPNKAPPTSLLRADNISLRDKYLEVDYGSARWNSSALAYPIWALKEFWTDDSTQRLIAITSDGTVYKFPHGYKSSSVLPTTGPSSLQALNVPTMEVGGNESTSSPRKLFIFTGTNQVQVITGDAETRHEIQHPAADWTNYQTYPTFGTMHQGRLIACSKHTAYMSSSTDHEDFTTIGAALQFPVFPGDGERLVCALSYKTRLYFVKYPRGLYYLDQQDPTDITTWAVRKMSGSFGAVSYQNLIQVLDDMMVATETGSITSMQASQAFGGVEASDLLSLLRAEKYMRDNTLPVEQRRQAVFYADKKLALFTYRSIGGTRMDRILVLDFNLAQPEAFNTTFHFANARVSWITKDQPNCLTTYRDRRGVARPIYGANDGYIYEMDKVDRVTGAAVAYTSIFETPYWHMGHLKPEYEDAMKVFDFVEFSFLPTSTSPLLIDVFVDDRKTQEGINMLLTKRVDTLGDSTNHSAAFDFNLGDSGNAATDDSLVEGNSTMSIRIPLKSSTGKRISFTCTLGNAIRGNFRITAITVYFRLLGQEQETS